MYFINSSSTTASITPASTTVSATVLKDLSQITTTKTRGGGRPRNVKGNNESIDKITYLLSILIILAIIYVCLFLCMLVCTI